MGPFTIELYYKHAPRTCRNFIELSQRGYYDNVKFHRIIEDFVVQGGDPTGTGRGGESIYGSKFEDEIKPKLKHTGLWSYKNGFVWHDLSENDYIYPVHGQEYVLKGSELMQAQEQTIISSEKLPQIQRSNDEEECNFQVVTR
ncbi:hypothetical protein IFM89_019594 [Coptis chinensis]|uniref:Peptidyl-prolyl cis-trans isomerase n=1 Tax=Coptis chinensis TaxID=261450 RepID=A0A835M329_9MAGN|nr:hypothetical protein IFM89_019594 [Coptis chinensis]